MSDIKCPPEKPGFFGIDYPQETAEQMQNLRANILVFDLDVQAARKKNKSDELNRLIQAWNIWKSTALAFCEAHDDWTDNVFTMEGQYQGLLYLCELQDYRKKFADLGGEVASPNPTDPKGQEPKSQVQDTISSITTLAVVGIAAYVIFAVIPRKN